MISTYSNKSVPNNICFPKTKLKNVSCVHCKRQFFIRDFMHLQGSQIPLLLNCGHAVCDGCVRANVAKFCTVCKTERREDTNQDAKCPLNLYVLGLIGLTHSRPIHVDDPDIAFHQPFAKRSSRQSLSLDQGHCFECGTEAVLRCQQCTVLFCHVCYSKIHGKALQNHCPVLLTEHTDDSTAVLSNRCPAHPSEISEYYCNECKISACSHCMLRSHLGHNVIFQREKNQELIEDFTNAYEKVAESLQRVHQMQKKLKSTLVFPNELQNSEAVEASINQYFAQLHGILQNVEKRLVDKLYEQRNYLTRKFDDIKKRLREQEDKLQAGLLMAASAKDNLTRVNLKDVIQKLENLADFPCYLVQNTISEDKKIVFKVDKSVIRSIEDHCKIEIPEVSDFQLLRSECLPENYEIEPLKQEEIPRLWNTSSSSKNSSPTPSIVSVTSRRSDSGCLVTGSSELVTVSYIRNPSCFYVQRNSCRKQLNELNKASEKYAIVATSPSEVIQNKLYLVKYGPDQKWYRGRIKSIVNDSDGKEVYTVFYVDYGNVESSVPISRLRNISAQLSAEPMMAIKCAFHDIEPKHGKWENDAIKAMLQMINDCKRDTTMHIINICGDTYYVDLCKYPSRDGDCPVSIRDALIFLEHGCFMTYDRLLRSNPESVRKFFQGKIELEKFQFVVCHYVESPDCIYVQKTGPSIKFLEKLMNDMTEEYEKNSKGIIYVPEIGMPCAAPFKDEIWYRARISGIPGERMVEVYYVDFGYTNVLRYDMIRVLHPKYMSSTTQAIKVSLKDVEPLSTDNGRWNSETNAFVKRHLERNIFKMIAFEEKNDVYSVRLYIPDDIQNINFNALLVKEGFAQSTGIDSHCASASKKSVKERKKKCKKSKETRKTMNDSKDANGERSKQTQDELDPFRIQVQVIRVESPDCIYVADVKREQINAQMQAKIQDFYNANCSAKREKWKTNSVCVVYSVRDKCYCRAKIIEMRSNKEVVVFFYDMGITETVSIEDVEPLHSDFLNAPAYLFKVKLAGILPCGGSTVWPSLSCEKLLDIVNENQHCQFYISKVAESEDDAISVELWVKQAKTSGPLEPTRIEINSVSRMLVENGVALPIRDFTETKSKILAIDLRHQLNKNEELSDESVIEWLSKNEGLDCTSNNSDNSSVCTNRKVEMSTSDTLSEDDNDDSDRSSSSEDIPLPPKLSAWIPAIPIEDAQFIAVPTYLDHDCVLYLHSKKQNGKTLRFIEETLEEYYKNAKIRSYDMKWNVGDLCVAQYHDNKKWYRAQVLKILENDMVQVVFVDYGNIDECAIGTLKKRVIMGHIPIQCTKCVIYGLSANTPDGKWSVHDLDKIHALLVEKECKVTILQRKPSEYLVSIMLIKPEKKELIYYLINDMGINARIKGADTSDTDVSINSEPDGSVMDSADVIIEEYIDEVYEKDNVPDISDSANIMESHTDSEIIQRIDDRSSVIITDTSNVTKDVNVNETNRSIEICECLEDMSIIESIENMPWTSMNCWEEQIDSSLQDNSCEVYSGNNYTQIDIPNDIVNIELLTSYIVDSTTFYAQFNENIQSEDLQSYHAAFVNMVRDMQENACEQPVIESARLGTPCCAQFTQDNIWYRSIINSYEQEKQLVRLKYVDYGNMEYQPLNRVRCLNEEWLNVPVMSIKCKLWGVEVTNDTNYVALLPKLERMLYCDLLRAKIKERHNDVMDVELYSDKECIKLLYGPLIEEGLFQLKKTKED